MRNFSLSHSLTLSLDKIRPQGVWREDTKDTIVSIPEEKANSCQRDSECWRVPGAVTCLEFASRIGFDREVSCLNYLYLTRFPTAKSDIKTRFETCSRYSHTTSETAVIVNRERINNLLRSIYVGSNWNPNTITNPKADAARNRNSSLPRAWWIYPQFAQPYQWNWWL